MALKLILDNTNDFSFDEYEIIQEQTNASAEKSLFIKGPYMMAEGVNKNRRKYKLHEMEAEVDRFKKEMIESNRAMGELGHPDSAEIDPERACILIKELNQDRNIFYGRSKVLSTPCGELVKSLIKDEVKFGVSTRALGSLTECTDYSEVSDFKLITIDVVADPSYPDAFVNGILESKQFITNKHGELEVVYQQFEDALKNLPRKEVQKYIFESLFNFIRGFNKKL